MILISTVEEFFKGKEVDYAKFLEIFEPNGLDGVERLDFRFYVSEPEDEKALFASYEVDDPRMFDLDDDEDDIPEEKESIEDDEDDEEDEDYEISYEDYPYPEISIFAGLEKQEDKFILSSFDICKVYPSMWPRAGTHVSSFTEFEAEYVKKRLSPILKV